MMTMSTNSAARQLILLRIRTCHVPRGGATPGRRHANAAPNAAVLSDPLAGQFNFLDVDRTFTVDHDEFAVFFEVMEVGTAASCITGQPLST